MHSKKGNVFQDMQEMFESPWRLRSFISRKKWKLEGGRGRGNGKVIEKWSVPSYLNKNGMFPLDMKGFIPFLFGGNTFGRSYTNECNPGLISSSCYLIQITFQLHCSIMCSAEAPKVVWFIWTYNSAFSSGLDWCNTKHVIWPRFSKDPLFCYLKSETYFIYLTLLNMIFKLGNKQWFRVGRTLKRYVLTLFIQTCLIVSIHISYEQMHLSRKSYNLHWQEFLFY